MPQSLAFFELMVEFANVLSVRIDQSAAECLGRYTPMLRSLGLDQGNPILGSLSGSSTLAADLHRLHLERAGPEPERGDAAFQGHRLFGPFYYEMRPGGVVRPHFVKLRPYAKSPLDPERRAESRQQIRAMFAHIREVEPEAREVLGNSWLYHVPAYRELYPSEYTRSLPTSQEDEFEFLALWGQFLDRYGRLRPSVVSQFIANVRHLESGEGLRLCFPFQVLTPRCRMDAFDPARWGARNSSLMFSVALSNDGTRR